MFLVYPRGVRVIIHTANLIYVDWNNKSQGLWMQDFPWKDQNSPSKGSRFENDLVEYLSALKVYILVFFYFKNWVYDLKKKMVLQLGMAMGRGGDEFYLPHPLTRISYTYLLPHPYPTEMKNWISSPSPTGSGIPAPSLSPHWIIFF